MPKRPTASQQASAGPESSPLRFIHRRMSEITMSRQATTKKTAKGEAPPFSPKPSPKQDRKRKSNTRSTRTAASQKPPTGAIRKTRNLLSALGNLFDGPTPAGAGHGDVLKGDGTWPFTARVVGSDIVVEDIVITCFGGAFDSMDDGSTASGISTKQNPNVEGVSIAMDGRQFPTLSKHEHSALDGCPLPRMPFFTQVEVTIEGKTLRPAKGIIDLGPGKQATTKPGEPHALDLSVAAARHFEPGKTDKQLANGFSKRGSFRILGGANFVHK